MPRFNSLQEFDEWRQGQGLSSVRETTSKLDAPTPQPNGTIASAPPVLHQSSAVSMGQTRPVRRRSFKGRIQRLIPALAWITAAIAAFIIWNLFAPFTSEFINWSLVTPFITDVMTWIISNVGLLSFGVAVLALIIASYVGVLSHHVHETLPQDILTLRSDVMRRIDILEASQHTSGILSEQTTETSPTLPTHTTPVQKEFEQWMQSEQSTRSR